LCIDFDGESVTNNEEQCARVDGASHDDETKYHYKLVECEDLNETAKYAT
jgi:hypothetical protein